jgi:hypothetical protein
VAARFAERQVSVEVLDEHEDDPETYEKPLAKKIQQTDAADDPRFLELAQALTRLMDHQGASDPGGQLLNVAITRKHRVQ